MNTIPSIAPIIPIIILTRPRELVSLERDSPEISSPSELRNKPIPMNIDTRDKLNIGNIMNIKPMRINKTPNVCPFSIFFISIFLCFNVLFFLF